MSDAHSVQSNNNNYGFALISLTSLFFMWGLITSLNDILIPKLKAVFNLSYTEAMMIQFCFFFAYFIVSLPAGYLIKRIGYKWGMVVGLIIAGIGCASFYPAAAYLHSYNFFLMALFVLASGITILQVAANPYVTALGNPATSSSRLTMTQAFNSLGTAIAPWIGGLLILTSATVSIENLDVNAVATAKEVSLTSTVSAAKQIDLLDSDRDNSLNSNVSVEINTDDTSIEIAHAISDRDGPDEKSLGNTGIEESLNDASSVQMPYLILAAILIFMSVIFARLKLPEIEQEKVSRPIDLEGSAWQYSHLVLGAVAIFVYVGAEVSIGSFLVNFLGEDSIAGLEESEAAKYVSYYWLGAMVGRFVGAVVMQRIEAGKALAFNAVSASVLVTVTVFSSGTLAMWSIVLVGLFNSIMFPTIFSLGLKGLGKHTSQASGILCLAIVGGAIVPLLQGILADNFGIQNAFSLALICYFYIAYYGLKGSKPYIIHFEKLEK